MVTVRHARSKAWCRCRTHLGGFGADGQHARRMLIGEASLKNLSGPITIADYAGQSVQQGLAYYLGFLALVSVSLGVLNLLPLPMLDGGHLMYYIFEGARPPGLGPLAGPAAARRHRRAADDDVGRPFQRRARLLAALKPMFPPFRSGRCARRGARRRGRLPRECAVGTCRRALRHRGHPRRGPAADRSGHGIRRAALPHRRHLHRRQGLRRPALAGSAPGCSRMCGSKIEAASRSSSSTNARSSPASASSA